MATFRKKQKRPCKIEHNKRLVSVPMATKPLERYLKTCEEVNSISGTLEVAGVVSSVREGGELATGGVVAVAARHTSRSRLSRTQLVLLTTCIVITRRAIASAEGRAVLNSDSYVINRNWKSLIMFGCSESNKTVYKRARANETGGRDARLRDF